MSEIKTFECKICKQLVANGIKGEKRIIGNRKYIREHLVNEHHIKGRKNKARLTEKEFGRSEISQNCIEYVR